MQEPGHTVALYERTGKRPRGIRPAGKVRVTVRGIPYWFDGDACWRRFVELQLEGSVDGLQDLANRVNVSRSTVSRFFAGCSLSPFTVRRILKELRLRLDDVFRPVDAAEAERDDVSLEKPATVWE